MSELERLLFEKRCPLFGSCKLRGELEEERTKRVILERRIEEYQNYFSKVLSKITETLALSHYIDRLSEISEVEAIYVFRREDILDIWTIIPEGNLNVEEKIAGVQCELMRIYKDLGFDFMIIPQHEAEISELVPKDAAKIFPPEL